MKPVSAINTPPSTGPMILPALLLMVSSDIALARRTSPDKSSIAVRLDGSSITLAIPWNRIVPKINQCPMVPVTIVTKIKMADSRYAECTTTNISRRLKRSAMCPANNDNTGLGPLRNTEINPTWKAEPVNFRIK